MQSPSTQAEEPHYEYRHVEPMGSGLIAEQTHLAAFGVGTDAPRPVTRARELTQPLNSNALLEKMGLVPAIKQGSDVRASVESLDIPEPSTPPSDAKGNVRHEALDQGDISL